MRTLGGMSVGRIFKIVPAEFQKKSFLVAISIFFRAVLDFAGVAVLVPVLVKLLNDGSQVREVLPYALSALAFVLLKGVAVVGLSQYRSRYVFSLYSALSARVLDSFLSRGLLFILSSDSIDLANKVNSVTMTFVSGVILSLLNALSALFLLVIIFSALMVYDPMATLSVFLVMGPLVLLYVFYMRKRVKTLGEEENKARRNQIRTVLEFFRGYPDYVINEAESMQHRRFSQAVLKVSDVRLRLEAFSASSSGFMEAVVILTLIIIMLFSAAGPWNISLTFGVFALAAIKLLPAVRSLIACWQSYKSSFFSVDVLEEILGAYVKPNGVEGKEKGEVNGEVDGEWQGHGERQVEGGDEGQEGGMTGWGSSSGRKDLETTTLDFKRAVELRDVTFCYPGADKNIFENLNLTINKGEYLGIKGHSGIGKTTLFNLLLGFYSPSEGGLYVDGRKLSGKDEESIPQKQSSGSAASGCSVTAWQRKVGYVPQDVFLVRGSFVDNVAFGRSAEEADREKVKEVLSLVGLLPWVESLPQGIDTPLTEAGNTISGGQKQRIGIARALYKEPSVLFLDEATSSVDVDSEMMINESLKSLSESGRDLTVVIIAHREETLAACNRVIDIEDYKPNRSMMR